MHTDNKASFLLKHLWRSCRNEVFFWSHAKRKPLLSSFFFNLYMPKEVYKWYTCIYFKNLATHKL